MFINDRERSNIRSVAMAATAPVHIVAIDDDPSIRRLIADYLGDNDIRVTALDNGREIAGVMARETIDLVILDLKLPGGLRRLTSPQGQRGSLTNSEFNLLVAFLAAPHRVLSRQQLLDLSRLHNDEVYDRSIDVQIGRLRKRIAVAKAHGELIRTERGEATFSRPTSRRCADAGRRRKVSPPPSDQRNTISRPHPSRSSE
jgi:DNA-binding response OmpR family regulator